MKLLLIISTEGTNIDIFVNVQHSKIRKHFISIKIWDFKTFRSPFHTHVTVRNKRSTQTHHSRVAGVEWGFEALLFSFSSSVKHNTWRVFTSSSKLKEKQNSLILFVLTLIVGNVAQRRVTGVTFALTLVEASFNPTL